MKRLMSIAGMMLVAAGLLAAPNEVETQGYYEAGAGAKKMAARIVTLSKGEYKVFIQSAELKNDSACVELFGKVEGEAVVLKGSGWELSGADGAFSGKSAAGEELDFKRVRKLSPTMGKKPPAGAVVLLDGSNFDNIRRSNGREWDLGTESQREMGVWEVTLTTKAKDVKEWPSDANPLPEGWKLTRSRKRIEDVNYVGQDGSIQVAKGGMQSVKPIEGSFDYHVEFLNPLRADKRGQGRGNSGVFFPCGSEIQVLDSFGMPTYTGGGCGGIYKWVNPAFMQDIPSAEGKNENCFNLASLPPTEWQTYDLEYRVKGKEVYLTAYQNGVKIHDNLKLKRGPRKGHVSFQDHGNPVRYRNIWYVPVK